MSKFELFGNQFRNFFCWCTVSGIVFRGYYPHTGSSPFICPSISTWRKSAILETPEEIFLPGETHAAHLARHPSPLHGKNRANWHHLQKIFSARESSSNVQNRAFWKPLSNSFFKLLRTSINSHRSSMWIPPAPPPVSGSILSAVPLCKNRGRMETLFKNYLISSVQHRLQRVLSSYGQRAFHLPLHIYMAKISDFGNTWAKNFAGMKLMLKLPYTLTSKYPSNLTPAKSNLVADMTMLDCTRKSSHHPEWRLAGTKIALRLSDAELIREESSWCFLPRG